MLRGAQNLEKYIIRTTFECCKVPKTRPNISAVPNVKHLYLMPKDVGFVIEVRDLRVKTAESICPFVWHSDNE